MGPDIYQVLQTLRIEQILLWLALLVLASVATSKLSSRLGVPVLLLFLGVGMLVGSDGPVGLYFADAWLSQLMGVTALAIILFSGGMSTEWRDVRPIMRPALWLATLGVLLTAVFVGLFVMVVLRLPIKEAMLLGSVISSTDAAAVFGVLRSRRAGLKGVLAPLLEMESGANDPMAVFLTTGLVALVTQPGTSFWSMVPLFITQMVFGGLLGYLLGKLAVKLLNCADLEYDGLYPVLLIALVLFIYSVTAMIRGSGFLAVYVAGIVIGNSRVIHKRSLSRFSDSMAWLMQILVFLTMGLLVFPSQLLRVAKIGLLVSAFLMFVARPLACFLVLVRSQFTVREKLLISWVGLRGAVPIVLATMPLLAGVEEAHAIFNVVFFVVLTSALLQGTSIPLVAKWLGVHAPLRIRQVAPIELHADNIDSDLVEMRVPIDSPAAGKSLVKLELPSETLVVLITRAGEYIVPTGSTTIEAGDTLMVLGAQERLREVATQLGSQPGLA